MGSLLLELKEMLRSNFISFSVNYFPRNCNRTVHTYAAAQGRSQNLAKRGAMYTADLIYDEYRFNSMCKYNRIELPI